MPSVTYGFNGNPDLIVVLGGGSYTVAAGKYAFVTGNVLGGSTVSLDGTIALAATSEAVGNWWVPEGTVISTSVSNARAVIQIFTA